MSLRTPRLALVFSALTILLSACAEPECPVGTIKIRNICRHIDAGISVDDAAVVAGDGAQQDEESDAGAGDSGAERDASAAGTDAGAMDAASGSTVTGSDASGTAIVDAGGTNQADSGVADASTMGAVDATADGVVSCGAGYTLTSGACQDIDECASANSCTVVAYPCVQTIAPGYLCQGQFADWHMPDAVAGAKFAPSFDVVTTPGTVIDNVTGLIWQRTIDVGTYTWDAAKVYCERLTWAGQGDWRLPSEIELGSISDETKSGSVDSEVFPNTPAAFFWSGSPYIGSSANAWAVGGAFWQTFATSSMYRVRCVRSGSVHAPGTTPADRYTVDTASATVTDTRTGLVWQSTASATSYAWSDAKAHCSGLGGWRLPTLKELLTLVDLTRASPSIDPKFSSTPTTAFWSASPFVGTTDRAWTVNFGNGYSTSDDVSVSNNVRCVR